jgi:hypothetical protein
VVFIWDSAVIDDRMQYVKIGQKVRVTFEGHTKNKKNQQMALFKVEVAKTGRFVREVLDR